MALGSTRQADIHPVVTPEDLPRQRAEPLHRHAASERRTHVPPEALTVTSQWWGLSEPRQVDGDDQEQRLSRTSSYGVHRRALREDLSRAWQRARRWA